MSEVRLHIFSILLVLLSNCISITCSIIIIVYYYLSELNCISEVFEIR